MITNSSRMACLRDIVQDIISNMMCNNGHICDVLLTVLSYKFIDADANINDLEELISNQLDHCKIDAQTRLSVRNLIVDHVQNERASEFCKSFSNMNNALSVVKKDLSVNSIPSKSDRFIIQKMYIKRDDDNKHKLSSLLYIGEYLPKID